jgi:hypothetical protein
VFAFFCADIGEDDDRQAGGGGGGGGGEEGNTEPRSAVSFARRWLSRLLLRQAPAAFLSLVQKTLGVKAADAVVSCAKYAFYERNPILQVQFVRNIIIIRA